MILKDFNLALRNLGRNKLLAAINVLGLSIGISGCLVIFLIANFELSFDTFQPDKDRIFRIYSTFSGGTSGVNRGVSTGMAMEVVEHFTGAESVANFQTFSAKVAVPTEKGSQKEFGHYNKIVIADPNYFKVFSYYQWLAGNPAQSLSEPFRVVITQSRARTYFGDLLPAAIVGKEIHYDDSLLLTVSGVIKDIEERTDLDFTDFISSETIEKSWLTNRFSPNNWSGISSSSQLFIKLAPESSLQQIQAQLPRLTEIYQSHNKESNWLMTPALQPLTDIPFDPEIGIFDGSRRVVERSTIGILMLTAGLLLFIASINFINLETAHGSKRAKEVGVRKVLGSTKGRLIRRFLAESFILCFLAVSLSVLLAAGAVQYFYSYMPAGLRLDLSDPAVIIFLVSCLFGVTLLAGLYPAFVLSSYSPAVALKNIAGRGATSGTRGAFVRKSLTIFQFSFAQVLIIGSIAIGLQIHYMLNKDLGFSTGSVLFVRTPWGEKPEKRQVFRNDLKQIPEIEMMSMHGSPPISSGWSSAVMEFDNGQEILKHDVYIKSGDTAYISLYQIRLLAGRNLMPVDSMNEYLINERYMRALGFTNPEDALGKVVNKKFSIVGVVSDFHTRSLHSEIAPTVIRYGSNDAGLGIRLFAPENKVADLAPGIEKVESAWKKVYPEDKFQYFFLEESMERFYETENRIGSLTRVATGIAILISCLGLFGLSSFTVVQRTKEIGIRKVLGATVNSIMFLLSKDFLKLVLIALAVSTPLAYYLTDRWLNNFAYRMDVSAWLFIGSGFLSLLIAFATISVRTVKAAKSDPVKSLRYE